MEIYLKHFIHGTKVAISEMEAESDEQNGWVRYTLDTPDSSAVPVNSLEIKRRRRKTEPLEDSNNGDNSDGS